MPKKYTFAPITGSDKIDILEDGKSISQGGPGYTADYARTLGYQAPVAPTPSPVLPTGKTPVVSSTSIRSELADRGTDPRTATFGGEEAYKKFVEQTTPKGPVPTRVSSTDQYNDLQQKYNLDTLQSELQGYDDESTSLENNLRTFKAKESDRQSGSFSAGRIAEEERNILDRQSYVTQKRTSVANRINNANKTIETLMTLTDKDYNNARSDYEFEYNKNIQMANSFKSLTSEARTDESQMRDDARANLTTIYNAIKDKKVDIETLTPAMTASIQALELQAGLPSGFFNTIKSAEPDAKIVSHSTYEADDGQRYTDVVFQRPDGGISVRTVEHSPATTAATSKNPTEDAAKPTFDDFLKAAEAEARMSFGPEARAELKKMYDQEYPASSSTTKAPAKKSTGGRSI